MKPIAPIAAVASSAFMGTLPELMGEHLRRLTLLGEREEHTSRNVQARVTCREHAERITAFMMAAAKAMPARSKMRVNGEMLMLPSAAVSRFGRSKESGSR